MCFFAHFKLYEYFKISLRISKFLIVFKFPNISKYCTVNMIYQSSYNNKYCSYYSICISNTHPSTIDNILLVLYNLLLIRACVCMRDRENKPLPDVLDLKVSSMRCRWNNLFETRLSRLMMNLGSSIIINFLLLSLFYLRFFCAQYFVRLLPSIGGAWIKYLPRHKLISNQMLYIGP